MLYLPLYLVSYHVEFCYKIAMCLITCKILLHNIKFRIDGFIIDCSTN
jgi:hypothetical protein